LYRRALAAILSRPRSPIHMHPRIAVASLTLLAGVVAAPAAQDSKAAPVESKAAPADSRPANAKIPKANATIPPATIEMWISTGIERLLECQDNGAWPYEGVYRVAREIPMGYRVGGTAIVGTALLYASAPAPSRPAKAASAPAAQTQQKIDAAIQRATEFVLKHLDDDLLAPSTENVYDVRIWGQSCALEYLCHLKTHKKTGAFAKEIDRWIPKLVETILAEEIDGGGWNYASRFSVARAESGPARQIPTPASFVTAPVVQSLLYARAAGATVPREIFHRAAECLHRSRLDSGSFLYSGALAPDANKASRQLDIRSPIQGSIARSAACEATLQFLGGGDAARIQKSLDSFYLYWDELEKRRKKSGTHEGPFAIAPYYFYYGHRYAAQAAECLPPAARPAERARLAELLQRTRDEDGTWNDRIFPRSRAFGTAMSILALLADRGPSPRPLEFEK
jgi:hypothetical protein